MTQRSILAAALVALSLLSGPAVARDKLTVLLDWFVNPDNLRKYKIDIYNV